MRTNFLINTIKNKFSSYSTFKKNALILLTGTIFSQIVYFLLAPIISRVYTPEQFGNFTLFSSVLAVFTLISTGQYELAITLPKDKKDSINIAALSTIVAVVVSILTFIGMLIFSDKLAEIINIGNIEYWIFLLPLAIFFSALGHILNYWYIYTQEFKKLSAFIIYRSVSINLSQIAQRFISFLGGNGILTGFVSGQFISISILIAASSKLLADTKEHFSLKSVLYLAKKYKNFPLFTLPAYLINILANNVPTLMLGSLFGLAVVGQYALTQKVLAVPGALISNAILGVFKERASRDFRESGSCRNIYVKTFWSLLKLSILPFTLIYIFSSFLVPLIFGPNWAVAGHYIRIMTFMYFLRFISSPLSYVLVIAEKQSINLIWQIFLLLFSIISTYFGAINNNPILTIKLFSYTYGFLYVVMLILSYKFSSKDFK